MHGIMRPIASAVAVGDRRRPVVVADVEIVIDDHRAIVPSATPSASTPSTPVMEAVRHSDADEKAG